MKLFKWMKRRREPSQSRAQREPLREFIYLDEVSLRSLLSSQTGEVIDSTSKQIAGSFDVEVGSSVAAGLPQMGSAELTSRFQTSNSSTLQTSRKATVQSWFRDFYNIPNLRVIEPANEVHKASSAIDLMAISNTSQIVKTSALERGGLVEFRVKLAADPIFHLGTMVSEFTGMSEDYPDMFAENNGLETLKEVQPVNRILQRLLAGLIPVRAEAIDYAVIEIDYVEYVVHRDVIIGLGIDTKPLVIVGVTEHLAYWKDIRRVLFSDAEFTVLCRISRSGLQASWTPVKLAELFRDLVPDLVEQMNEAGRSPFSVAPDKRNSVSTTEVSFVTALHLYKAEVLRETGKDLSGEQEVIVSKEIMKLLPQVVSASGQRAAYATVKLMLADLVGVELKSSKDIELREYSRNSSGLSLLPSLQPEPVKVDLQPPEMLKNLEPRLLDVDFVAIYW